MVKDERTDARLRVHHHAFRQENADRLGLEQFPHALLIIEIRACRVAEAVSLAAVTGRETLPHCQLWWIREAPVLPDAAVKPFGRAFGSFDGQCLQRMGLEKTAGRLGFLRALADSLARSDDQKPDGIAAGTLRRQDVVAQTQAVRHRLAAEVKRVDRLTLRRLEQSNRVALALGLEETPHGAHLH